MTSWALKAWLKTSPNTMDQGPPAWRTCLPVQAAEGWRARSNPGCRCRDRAHTGQQTHRFREVSLPKDKEKKDSHSSRGLPRSSKMLLLNTTQKSPQTRIRNFRQELNPKSLEENLTDPFQRAKSHQECLFFLLLIVIWPLYVKP